MAYENDFIMRQVRDMTRMLAKILFGKNTSRRLACAWATTTSATSTISSSALQECRHRVTANTKLESASSRTSINWFRTSTASLQERFCRNVQVIGLARYFFCEREQERESNILKTEVY